MEVWQKVKDRSGSSSGSGGRKKKKSKEPRLAYLSSFRPESKIRRGGCILYTGTSSGLQFCFGVDSVHEEYTDFGGSFDAKKDKDIIDTALRELKEETLGLIEIKKCEELGIALAAYNHKELILFVPVSIDKQRFTAAFTDSIGKCNNSEMKSCQWLSVDEVKKHYDSGKMYKKVSRLLKPLGDKLFDNLK